MGMFLLVAKTDKLGEYQKIAKEYDFGFEYNDFYMPDVADNEKMLKRIIERYTNSNLPKYCTMHGAFLDVTLFSYDREIRRISEMRVRQSMEIARRIGAKAVVFHTNINPFLDSDEYFERAVRMTADFIEKLLLEYGDINIYIENMFDDSPEVMEAISEILCGYDNYGVCFDYAHASISKTDISVWIDRLKSHIKHIHINDNDLVSDMHMAVGDGSIDWYKFKEYYERYFSDCTVLIETTPPELQRKSINYLRDIGII